MLNQTTSRHQFSEDFTCRSQSIEHLTQTPTATAAVNSDRYYASGYTYVKARLCGVYQDRIEYCRYLPPARVCYSHDKVKQTKQTKLSKSSRQTRSQFGLERVGAMSHLLSRMKRPLGNSRNQSRLKPTHAITVTHPLLRCRHHDVCGRRQQPLLCRRHPVLAVHRFAAQAGPKTIYPSARSCAVSCPLAASTQGWKPTDRGTAVRRKAVPRY